MVEKRVTSFESQAKEWQASATLQLSGTVHGQAFWVHELLQQKILFMHTLSSINNYIDHTNA